MSRLSAVLLLAGLAFAAMFAPWPAGGASSPAGPTPTPTASAGTVATVAIDTDTNGNTSSTVGRVDTCISVPNGSTFTIDVVMVGLPAGQELSAVNYDIDYNPAVVQLGNDDDGDGKYDEDTQVGDGDEDGDGEAGEEGTSGGGTIGHDPDFVLMGSADWSQGNGNDGPPVGATSTGTWSDFSFTFFKLSDYPTGPRDGTLNRITVRAVGAGVSTLNLRDLYGTQDPNSQPTLVSPSGAQFTIGNGSSGDATIAVDTVCQIGCMTYTATPTVSPTPWPSPPWTPYAYVPICNDTGQAVSDLHVRLNRTAANADPIASAPGCPEPVYFYSPSATSYTSISIDWGTPCVHPGEMVGLYFYADCTTPEPGCSPPHASCFYWTADGEPVPSASPAINPNRCADPSPIPTATPQPTGPCPARGTPPVTYAPTPTPGTPTPTPGPTSRDVALMTTIPFCNDAGESASDLHVHFAFPYSGRTFKANPPGCPEPSFAPVQYGLDTFDLGVDWGVDCVDAGESLTIEFIYVCGDVPCNTPQPFCYTWTRFGVPVYQGPGDCTLPTPTPTLTPTPTPTPTPPPTPTPIPGCDVPPPLTPAPGCPETPTPTPPVDVTVWTFLNDTGEAASGLHARYSWPFSARLVENAPGCPQPTLSPPGSNDGNFFELDWGVPCVDSGELVWVEVTSEPPAARLCSYWSVFGSALTSPGGGGCLRSGDLNCSDTIDSADALRVLAIVAGFAVTQEACASPDVDCDGDEDAVDALKILRYVAGMPYTQHEPCTDIGQPES